MRKRRTREHVFADLGVHHVEGFVLRCGWTVERTRHDFGIDSDMQAYHLAGEVENGKVQFQLKASDPHSLVYRLTPFEAYRQGPFKKI